MINKFGTFNTGNPKADASMAKLTHNPSGHTYGGPTKLSDRTPEERKEQNERIAAHRAYLDALIGD